MTYSAWDTDDPTSSSQRHHRFKCALGINKTTGRLQWCPGCKCIKMLVILPLTLLPVLLVFLWLAHISSVGSVHSRDLNQRSFTNDQSNFLANSIDDGSTVDEIIEENAKCVLVQYSMSETVDNEEKELLKDARTSFLPPDSEFLPPNCQTQRDQDWSADNRNELINNEFYQSFAYRRRRESTDDESIYNVSQQEIGGPSVTIDLSDAFQEKNDPYDKSEQSIDSDAVQAFWKDEGIPCI